RTASCSRQPRLTFCPKATKNCSLEITPPGGRSQGARWLKFATAKRSSDSNGSKGTDGGKPPSSSDFARLDRRSTLQWVGLACAQPGSEKFGEKLARLAARRRIGSSASARLQKPAH